MKTFFTAIFTAAYLIVGTATADTTTVGFDGGNADGFVGNFVFDAAGGNPGGTARMVPVGNQFPSLRTTTNSALIGDFSSFDSVTFGFDVRVDSITDFIGNEIFRPLGFRLVDNDIQGGSGSSGVFFEIRDEFGDPIPLGAVIQDDWTHYEVTIGDLTAAALPPGWIGFGEEDPNTFEPILPNGASFATVLAGVDSFELSGAVPGFFFNDANFDIRIDNITVTTTSVPEPTSACLILLTGLFGASRRRNRV